MFDWLLAVPSCDNWGRCAEYCKPFLCQIVTDWAYRSFMPRGAVKPSQIRIRISEGDTEILDKLGGEVLSRTDVATVLLKGAIEAVKINRLKVPFPPKFAVSEEENQVSYLNEKEAAASRRK
jgi:hypothetical protein